MNKLVKTVIKSLGASLKFKINIPYSLGLCIGYFFDFLKFITGKNFVLSSIRIRKFCANSMYKSAVKETKFKPPFSLAKSIKNTISHEFNG
jgi:hypothetical protein